MQPSILQEAGFVTFLRSINPGSEEVLADVPALDIPGIDQVIATARSSWPSWKSRSIKERQKLLAALQYLLEDRKQQIAELIAMEQGKPVAEALAAEIVPSLAILKYLHRNAHKILRSERVNHEMILFAHKQSYFRWEPYGVTAVISPWNFPFSVPLPQIAAALVTGNTVVFKPSPQAILVAQALVSLFQDAGFPGEVVQLAPVADADAPYFASHPGIDKILFTGSTAVGKKVMAQAAETVKSVVLELGGKDAAIVAADADIRRAAKGIVWGALFGSGQVCASVERVYVERAVAVQFIKACLDEIAEIKVGDPLDTDTDLGPLSNSEQLEKVLLHIEDAVAKGARLLYGGKRLDRPGYFLLPALLVDVDHTMAVMREETFGPVLPIMVVDDVETAIRMANDSIYGLTAFGWTRSRRIAGRLMEELQAGTVMINDATSTWGEPLAPWTGLKQSGLGHTRSPYGLLEMVQLKYVSYDAGRNRSNLWWFPYGATAMEIMTQAAGLLFARRVSERLRALLKLLTFKRFILSMHWPAVIKKLHKLY